MLNSMDFARVAADEQIHVEPQQLEGNLVCGPKPLAMALKHLRSGCVDGWSAQNVTTIILAFLPTLQQRALRKREKLNAQGPIWLPTVTPALRALDVELQSHADLSLLVSPILSKILQGERADLGNFICILIAALQKAPFPVQHTVMVPALESMLADHSDLIVHLFASDVPAANPFVNMLSTAWTTLTPKHLKTGMKVHFKCVGITSSMGKNLRVGHYGKVDGNGWFGARATWTVNVVAEHDGFPVVTLRTEVNDHSSYLHLSEDGIVDTSDAGGADCQFLVVSKEGSCVALHSHSKPPLRVCIEGLGAENVDAESLFTILPEQKTLKNVGRLAKHFKSHEDNQKMQKSGDDDLAWIACSDLKDGHQVHFRCMSMHDKKARNLRVGESGCLEGFGGCGARATWTVGLVGQHEGAPIVTLCVHVKGQVCYLRVTEDEEKIDGWGTGDSRCHFIVRTHEHSLVELQWLANPSVKVCIDPSGHAFDAGTKCEDAQFSRFTILPVTHSDKTQQRHVVAKEAFGKIKQAIGGNALWTKLKLHPGEIQSGMKVHICCLGRPASENRNLRVRSDGDVEGRGGFGARATWTIDAVDQRGGAVVFALRACIDERSWYLRAVDNGSRIDGRGEGGPECMFSVYTSGPDGTLGLRSLLWPASRVNVGPCGKLLDPLSEGAHDAQAFKLLRACNSDFGAASPKDAPLSVNVTGSVVPTGGNQNFTTMIANDLKDGLRVHLKCTSMLHKKVSNLRVREDGCLEGHGGCGPRATWTVGRMGEIGGAPIVTLCVHIKGQVSYLHVAEDGKNIDARGTGGENCYFIATMQGDSCVGLHWLGRPSVRLRIGSSGESLDPCVDGDLASEQFTILSAVPQHPAHRIICAARSIRRAQVELRQSACKAQLPMRHGVSHKEQVEPNPAMRPQFSLKVPPTEPNEPNALGGTLANSSPGKKLEVLTVQTLRDGLQVHVQCNGRCGAQRQNLRLCASGDVEGLGMFGNPATWTLHIVGEYSGFPIVTLHVESQGAPHYLHLDKQRQKIDGRGHGGVDSQFMLKTLHPPSSVCLQPVVSPLARLGVGVDGTLLDPFAGESDLQFSFSLLLSRRSDTPEWQFVDESRIRQGNEARPTKFMAEPPQEWSVLDSKDRQSGDDW